MKISFLFLVGLSTVGAFVHHSTPLRYVQLNIRSSPKKMDSLQMTMAPSVPMMATTAAASTADDGLARRMKIGGIFGLWYVLNIGYNIYNKKVLNLAPELTYISAWLQLALGLFYVIPVWGLGLRKAPELTTEEVKTLTPIALLHMLTHLGAVVSLGAGAVSFTHIVKAAEPAVSAAMTAIFLKTFFPLPVYLSLLPVMGGVAIASMTELTFTWLGFIAAMVSNFASAGRGIVGKISMTKPVGKNMGSANLYAVMTILATLLLAPISFAMEGSAIIPTLTALADKGLLTKFISESVLAAIFYYAYNEVAFLALDNVAPVTHALGNTIKRVVIILTSVVVFGTTMTTQGAIGSAIAIGGVLLYSVAKEKFK